MSDTADTPALVEVPPAVWTASVRDPNWFAAVIGPRLVGTLTAIAGGYINRPHEPAREALDDVIALCEAHVAGLK